MSYLVEKYDLNNQIVVIADGTDTRCVQYAESIIINGGIPILLGNNQNALNKSISHIKEKFKKDYYGFKVDISNKEALLQVIDEIKDRFKRVDVLINNLLVKPTLKSKDINFSSPEDYPLELWNKSLKYNLTGTFLACQQFGKIMLSKNKGVILNIVGVESLQGINPSKYKHDGISDFIPAIDYSVAKASVINLTRYIATYWVKNNIRTNCLVQGDLIVEEGRFPSIIANHIPLNRLAKENEFNGAILFLISDASSYMTGSILVIDGGASTW